MLRLSIGKAEFFLQVDRNSRNAENILKERSMKKIGVIGIVLKAGRERVEKVQSLLSDYGEIIVGRMGVPDKATGINTISLIVNGDTEKISALCGKLGRIEEVNVKSAVMTVEDDNN